MSPLEKATSYIVKFFDQKVAPIYLYHNLEHTLAVLASVERLSAKSDITPDELLILQFAALFHDTGYAEGPENHEERSVTIADKYLSKHDFDPDFITKVKACILATKMNSKANNKLDEIIQDADLSSLASKNYFDIAEMLRRERNNIFNDQMSKSKWNETNIEFLKHHTFNTEAAKELYQPQKNINLAALEKQQKEKKDKKKAKETPQTISANKSAQTQFKTALRNHIDLSNIADNKANIMLSVNALILTLALPFLIDKSMANPKFLLPTIIMSGVCLASMIFATLATRPIKMSGYTTQDKIKSNQSNLFFFGNYYKMTYDEYKSGVAHVLSETQALDDSITRDLYYLGRSLGAKFSHLRWCYTIFMYGISVTVAALLVVYVI
ncbi:MAG: Pycsar system effector family protein [Bacteroidota bacterium]